MFALRCMSPSFSRFLLCRPRHAHIEIPDLWCAHLGRHLSSAPTVRLLLFCSSSNNDFRATERLIDLTRLHMWAQISDVSQYHNLHCCCSHHIASLMLMCHAVPCHRSWGNSTGIYSKFYQDVSHTCISLLLPMCDAQKRCALSLTFTLTPAHILRCRRKIFIPCISLKFRTINIFLVCIPAYILHRYPLHMAVLSCSCR